MDFGIKNSEQNPFAQRKEGGIFKSNFMFNCFLIRYYKYGFYAKKQRKL